MMWRAVTGISALWLAVAPAHAQDAANAEAPAQALGQCMVLKTTGADRLTVARWMLAGMASGPQMADVVTVSPGKKVEYDRAMAALFTRLLVKDCPDQSRALFALGGQQGFATAGEALGRVAMQELLSNPKATAALEEYAKYLNQQEFKPVLP